MKATVSFPSVILALIFCTAANLSIWGQDRYKIAAIGFYNLENLFDLVNDTTINDEDFLPTGSYVWTEDKYKHKQANMAKVIAELGLALVCQLEPLYLPGLVAFATQGFRLPLLKLDLHPRGARIGWMLP